MKDMNPSANARRAPSFPLTLLLVSVLTACATPPVPGPSSLPVAPAWPVAVPATLGGDNPVAASLSWRSFFTEPPLQHLITLALANNRDLRVAALNVEKTQAQYQIQRAEALPIVRINTADTRQRVISSSSNQGNSSQQFSVNLGIAAYELDFFGRMQSLREQALEQYLATAAAQRSVQISLVAQVASAYYALAADQERLQLAQETWRNQSATLQMNQQRFELGATTLQSVNQARVGAEGARGDVALFTARVAQQQNTLTLLLGTPPPATLLPQGLPGGDSVLHPLSVGLPSSLLQARPDILALEHQLKAANANIAAARAAFFPSIVLTTSIGTSSTELFGLFKSPAHIWSFIPQISLPIFDGGRSEANLKVAQANRNVLLAQYEKAIQTAFAEVADALAERSAQGERLAAGEALLAASIENQQLSEARFSRGADSYLPVLEAQRTRYSAQQNLLALRQARLGNQITLYKALGGGAQDAE